MKVVKCPPKKAKAVTPLSDLAVTYSVTAKLYPLCMLDLKIKVESCIYDFNALDIKGISPLRTLFGIEPRKPYKNKQ